MFGDGRDDTVDCTCHITVDKLHRVAGMSSREPHDCDEFLAWVTDEMGLNSVI